MRKGRLFFVLSFFMLSCCLFSACRESAETAVPRLVKQLKSRDAHERNLAAKALGDYGKDAAKAVAPLNRALWDDNMGVRTSAAYSLKKIDTPKARQAIEFYQREKDRQNKLREAEEQKR
jgi:HEAT repeat protein